MTIECRLARAGFTLTRDYPVPLDDDHTKNHSFLMDSDGAWSLSSAYDVTHAYNPKSIWTSQHLMSVNGKFSDAEFKDFVVVSERHGFERATSIIAEVNDAVASWSEHAAEAGIPAAAQAEVAADLRSIRR
ncbi:HipA domain-containing protein [Cryobacterium gelidum]|uniref:HipA domain-containing protein n=1 Tax=Cryobacterium gelidum TaxID=1259164 RepID=A0A4R9B1P7_9MICO|nr:HipA domain-containing protein [Cryobacterium gelidum]TFD73487.1 HipA domain-containing protein [Cryobacterium gelidum]